MKLVRRLSLFGEDSSPNDDVHLDWPELIDGSSAPPRDAIALNLLSHGSHRVRIAAFDLVTYSVSPKTDFHEDTLASLAVTLPTLFSDADAGSRSELLGAFKLLCTRLQFTIRQHSERVGLANTHKGPPQHSREVVQSLPSHVKFATRCLENLLHELDPSCSYQRHVLALKCLAVAVSCDLVELTKVSRKRSSELES